MATGRRSRGEQPDATRPTPIPAPGRPATSRTGEGRGPAECSHPGPPSTRRSSHPAPAVARSPSRSRVHPGHRCTLIESNPTSAPPRRARPAGRMMPGPHRLPAPTVGEVVHPPPPTPTPVRPGHPQPADPGPRPPGRSALLADSGPTALVARPGPVGRPGPAAPSRPPAHPIDRACGASRGARTSPAPEHDESAHPLARLGSATSAWRYRKGVIRSACPKQTGTTIKI